jgi:gas vesicle protein
MNDRIYYSREAEMQAQRQFIISAAFVALLSVTVGAAIAVLFTPRTGREIRHELESRAGEALSQGREVAEKATVRGREVAEQIAEDAQHTLKKAQSEVENRVANLRS